MAAQLHIFEGHEDLSVARKVLTPTGIVGKLGVGIVFPVHMYMLLRCVYMRPCVSAYTTFYESCGFLIYFMCEFRPLGVGGELVSHKRSSTHSLRCPVCCVYIYMFVLFVYSTCPCRVGVGFLSLLSVPLIS